MARQLTPLLGGWAKDCLAIGLLAAGFSSALTAPLAAAYATSGILGWPPDLRSRPFRAVWAAVVVLGMLFATVLGKAPVQAIVFAQAANGILLPFVAVYLLVVMNRKALLSEYANRAPSNVLGLAVVVVAAGLGSYHVFRALNAL
jgi:manganese transport protein